MYTDAKAAYMRVEDAMNQKQLDKKNGSSLWTESMEVGLLIKPSLK
ncbi:MAG: hypothetical protein ACLS36_01355 [Streptococcus sp.]